MTDIALALSLPLTVGLFVWLLQKQNDRMWREVQTLLNRIQSPETAVAQTLVDNEVGELGPPDTEWTELREHDRLIESFTEDG